MAETKSSSSQGVRKLHKHSPTTTYYTQAPCHVSLSQLFLCISLLFTNSWTVFCFLLTKKEKKTQDLFVDEST